MSLNNESTSLFPHPIYNKDFKCETYWHEIQWERFYALNSLALFLCLALSSYSSVFFIFLSQIRGRGGSPLSSLWQRFSPPLMTYRGLVLPSHLGMPDDAECHGPVSPCSHTHISAPLPASAQDSGHTESQTCHWWIWLETAESLDVGNKSARTYLIRPGLILINDLRLRSLCLCKLLSLFLGY